MLAGATKSETARLALARAGAATDINGDVLWSAHDTITTAAAIKPIDRQWEMHDMRHPPP
jgi:hypothetical protein